jgi:hypothetical protein
MGAAFTLGAGFNAGFAETFAGAAGRSFAAGFAAAVFVRAGFAAVLAARFAGFAGLALRVARADDEGRALAAGPLLLVFVFPRGAG